MKRSLSMSILLIKHINKLQKYVCICFRIICMKVQRSKTVHFFGQEDLTSIIMIIVSSVGLTAALKKCTRKKCMLLLKIKNK